MAVLQNLLSLKVLFVAGLVLIPGVLVLLLAFLLILAIYNLFFHPLSGFPGPKHYAASRIPYIIDAITGQNGFKLIGLHEKYGEVVRIAPNELSYINTAAYKDIYSTRVGSCQMQKDPAFYSTPIEMPSIFLSNDADHSRMRRLLSHAFSEKALRDQEPIIQEYVNLLIERLHGVAKSGNPTNMVHWLEWATFDLTGDLSFGESFGCLRNSASNPWIELIAEGVISSTFLSAANRIPGFTQLLLKLLPKGAMQKMEQHIQMSKDLSDKRMNKKTERLDFMTPILKHNDNSDRGMSVQELRGTSMVIIVGGSETTASVLSASIWYLLKNPSLFANLATEIRTSFVRDEDLTISSLTPLKYLNAVINEALRIYPPAPQGSPRIVPGEGETILGRWVPGGTCVNVPQYAVTHSTSNFSQPDDFLPERWLGDYRFDSDNKNASQPFSYGPRNCIGKNLAYAEMRLLLSKIIWNFDLQLQPSSNEWFPHNMYNVWKKPPLLVKLIPIVKT